VARVMNTTETLVMVREEIAGRWLRSPRKLGPRCLLGCSRSMWLIYLVSPYVPLVLAMI